MTEFKFSRARACVGRKPVPGTYINEMRKVGLNGYIEYRDANMLAVYSRLDSAHFY